MLVPAAMANGFTEAGPTLMTGVEVGMVTISVTMIGSSIGGIVTVDGGGGNVVLMVEPSSGTDCVKLEPEPMLATLLSPALVVNVIVAPPSAAPDKAIVREHAPPEGSVVGDAVEPFEQAIGPKVYAGDEITALLSDSPVEPTPIFDTVITRVAIAPDTTVPKPTLLGEKNTTGAATLISGVIVTESSTLIFSPLSARSSKVGTSSTLMISETVGI